MTDAAGGGFPESSEERQSWHTNSSSRPLTKEQATRMMEGAGILGAALAARSPEFAEFTRNLGEVVRPMLLSAQAVAEHLAPSIKACLPYLSELQKIVNAGSIDRAAEALEPTLPDLTSSINSVLERITLQVEAAAAQSSAFVVERFAAAEARGADVNTALVEVASAVAEAEIFNDLWPPLHSEIEDVVGSSLVASNLDFASWYTFSLPYALRFLIPSIDTVHAFSTAVSLAVVAVISNGILLSGYPGVWEYLDQLHVTPFELLAYIVAAWVVKYISD